MAGAGAYKLTDNTRIAVHSAGARDRACALKHTSDLTLIKHAVLNGTAGAGNDNNRCGGILSKDADSVSGVNGAAPAHAHTWLTRLSRERSSAQRWGFGRDMSVVLRRMMALSMQQREVPSAQLLSQGLCGAPLVAKAHEVDAKILIPLKSSTAYAPRGQT